MSTPQSVAERRRLETFRTMASERLTRLNLGWIQVEQGQGDPGLSAELQRELHTLKGEAGLLGFTARTRGLGITAAQDWCAAALHTSRRAWQQWESGDRAMHSAFWELLRLKADLP